MLSILFWCGEDMEAAGEPQRINRKVNFAPLPGNLHLNFAPVVLELISRLSFEANSSAYSLAAGYPASAITLYAVLTGHGADGGVMGHFLGMCNVVYLLGAVRNGSR